MGIKHMFSGWFRKNFSNRITMLKKGQKVNDVNIDTFLVDLNGLFHSCAQKVYKYGNYKEKNLLLSRNSIKKTPLELTNEVFTEICKEIDNVVSIVNPKKTLFLAIDGPAPFAKICQQRSRRFLSSKMKIEGFDTCSLTPGTEFMDSLSTFINSFIQDKKEKKEWTFEVIFSTEKEPGEGEHKLIKYARDVRNEPSARDSRGNAHTNEPSARDSRRNDSFCIYGMDGDLVMLILSSQVENFYILRENQEDIFTPFFFIDMKGFKDDLLKLLIPLSENSSSSAYENDKIINDFVFMFFMVGNDFLPQLPCIEILEGGIDLMIKIYKKNLEKHGYLTKFLIIKNKDGVILHKKVKIRRTSLKEFFKEVSKHETSVFENKIQKSHQFFPDPLLLKHMRETSGAMLSRTSLPRETSGTSLPRGTSGAMLSRTSLCREFDINIYKKDYYQSKFSTSDVASICTDYIEGLQWVLTYYTTGCENWLWNYKHNYSPFMSDLWKNTKNFKEIAYPLTKPIEPYLQLLCVLPVKSSHLLPFYLRNVLKNELKDYCPEKFEIDLAGKRQEWEGIVKLPLINYEIVKVVYDKYKMNL
jgi:5'-3' exonuclease